MFNVSAVVEDQDLEVQEVSSNDDDSEADTTEKLSAIEHANGGSLGTKEEDRYYFWRFKYTAWSLNQEIADKKRKLGQNG